MSALMSGMVILMIPAFLICTGVTILAIRKRREWAQRDAGAPLEPTDEKDDARWR